MRKTRKIRVFTVFSGYDSQFMALMLLAMSCNSDIELVGWCEIDNNAIKSHNAVFPEYEGCHYRDVTEINWDEVPDFDLLIYSSCCQSLSITGAMQGMEKGSGTQSSLIWYVLDGIRKKKPKYCVLENVANMVSNTFMPSFLKWHRAVDECGYRSYAKVLSATEFNIPQKRKRVFLVSIREDIKKRFSFPKPVQLTKDATDLFEKTVDEKYYFPHDEVMRYLLALSEKKVDKSIVASTPTPTGGKMVAQYPSLTCGGKSKKMGDIHVIPTITATGNDSCTYKNLHTTGHFPKCGVVEVWKDGVVPFSYSTILESAKKQTNKKKRVSNASQGEILEVVRGLQPGCYIRLRKMTPRELFRFMGVTEHYIDKLCNSGNDDAMLYKQAGNSIVVDVLVHLFTSLLIDE